ncbi:hypothetical protein D9M70_471890 [compost metagenome]
MELTLGILGHEQLWRLALCPCRSAQGRPRLVGVLKEFVRSVYDFLSLECLQASLFQGLDRLLYAQVTDGGRCASLEEIERHVHPVGVIPAKPFDQRAIRCACRNDVVDEGGVAGASIRVPAQRTVHAHGMLHPRFHLLDKLDEVHMVVGCRIRPSQNLLRVFYRQYQGVMPLAVNVGLNGEPLGHAGTL